MRDNPYWVLKWKGMAPTWPFLYFCPWINSSVVKAFTFKAGFLSGRKTDRQTRQTDMTQRNQQSCCKETQRGTERTNVLIGGRFNQSGSWFHNRGLTLLLISEWNTEEHVLITNETQTHHFTLQEPSVFWNWASREECKSAFQFSVSFLHSFCR